MKKRKTIDEDDFAALDKLAHSLTPEKMRPMSVGMRRHWNAARRGRPPKPHGTKAVPTMITVDPLLLRQIDAHAKKAGVSRSEFIAKAARRQLRKVG